MNEREHNGIKNANILARGTLAVSMLLGTTGCAPIKPPFEAKPSLLPSPTLAEKNQSQISQAEIDQAAVRSIQETNRVLGLNLDQTKVSQNIILIETPDEFRNLLAKESNGTDTDINRVAVTTSGAKEPKKIYIYKPSLTSVTSLLPSNPEGKAGRIEFEEYVINHELIHYLALPYKSDLLFNLVYKNMLANLSGIKGKQLTPDFVSGAEIKAIVDNRRVSAFQNLEEAEAYIISDFVIKQRNTQRKVQNISPEDLNIKNQVLLLSDLLTRVDGGNKNSAIKTLATLRTKEYGREQWANTIAQKLKLPVDKDALFYSMSILYAIDTGNSNLYSNLVNLYNK